MKKIGDRKDGKKVRDIDGLHNILIDLKPRRCDSDVYINQSIDVTDLKKYILDRKEEYKLTYFHAFVTAFAKLFYNYDLLNRFICNRVTYRRNDVIIGFVVKIAFDDKSEEVMINIKVDSDDNIFTISKKISNRIDKIRNSKFKKKENTNNIVDIVGKFPNIIRVPILGVVKYLDKYGHLPSSIIKDNIYYSSMIVSNLGNFKIGSIYHNLTNFGTSSMLSTIGVVHKENVCDENGKSRCIDVCDFGINCDERIADGYYFAKAMKTFEYILNNPKMLEDEVSKKIEINK